jgi:SNF2 family DNA or RNA helicase
MQNHVRDLLSYFRFLRYDPFNTPAGFAANISDAIRTNEVRGLRRLQQILKLVMLRRTKGSKLEGKPIIDLPEVRASAAVLARQAATHARLCVAPSVAQC